MNYYQLNKDWLLQKAKDKYHNNGGKEKAAKYYEDSKEVLKEKARNKYRNLSEEEKEVKRAEGRDRYRNMTEDEKNRLKEYQKKYQAARKVNINFFCIV